MRHNKGQTVLFEWGPEQGARFSWRRPLAVALFGRGQITFHFSCPCFQFNIGIDKWYWLYASGGNEVDRYWWKFKVSIVLDPVIRIQLALPFWRGGTGKTGMEMARN